MATMYYKGRPVGGASDSSYEPIKVDHLYILSASVLDQAFNVDGAVDEFNAFCRQLGIEPPELHTQWANSGDDSSQYIDKLPDLLDDASGRSNICN